MKYIFLIIGIVCVMIAGIHFLSLPFYVKTIDYAVIITLTALGIISTFQGIRRFKPNLGKISVLVTLFLFILISFLASSFIGIGKIRTGTVIDAVTKKPIAGITVSRNFDVYGLSIVDHATGKLKRLQIAVTDNEGRYKFPSLIYTKSLLSSSKETLTINSPYINPPEFFENIEYNYGNKIRFVVSKDQIKGYNKSYVDQKDDSPDSWKTIQLVPFVGDVASCNGVSYCIYINEKLSKDCVSEYFRSRQTCDSYFLKQREVLPQSLSN